jgi:hypothetical protein
MVVIFWLNKRPAWPYCLDMSIAQLETAAVTARNAYKTAHSVWQTTRSKEARVLAAELGTVSANAEMALINFKNQNGLV